MALPTPDAADAVDDLRLLLIGLKMGDHARPQTPHEVFLQAIDRIYEWRQALQNIAAEDSRAGDIARKALYEHKGLPVDWRAKEIKAAIQEMKEGAETGVVPDIHDEVQRGGPDE